MQQPVTTLSLDLETRIRRSQGRTGRTHSANVKLTRDELSELEAVAKLEQNALLNLLKPLVMGKTVSQEWITEAMAAVRREKRKAAEEVKQQYRQEQDGGR